MIFRLWFYAFSHQPVTISVCPYGKMDGIRHWMSTYYYENDALSSVEIPTTTVSRCEIIMPTRRALLERKKGRWRDD
jgi:hypothetical protein